MCLKTIDERYYFDFSRYTLNNAYADVISTLRAHILGTAYGKNTLR